MSVTVETRDMFFALYSKNPDKKAWPSLVINTDGLIKLTGDHFWGGGIYFENDAPTEELFLEEAEDMMPSLEELTDEPEYVEDQ